MTTKNWQDALSGGYGTLTRGPDRTGYRYLRLSLADERATAMATRAEHYRELARECLEVAKTLPNGKLRTSMLEMADTWERLAQEQNHATDLRQKEQVQQQQQPQPKNDDKKE